MTYYYYIRDHDWGHGLNCLRKTIHLYLCLHLKFHTLGGIGHFEKYHNILKIVVWVVPMRI